MNADTSFPAAAQISSSNTYQPQLNEQSLFHSIDRTERIKQTELNRFEALLHVWINNNTQTNETPSQHPMPRESSTNLSEHERIAFTTQILKSLHNSITEARWNSPESIKEISLQNLDENPWFMIPSLFITRLKKWRPYHFALQNLQRKMLALRGNLNFTNTSDTIFTSNRLSLPFECNTLPNFSLLQLKHIFKQSGFNLYDIIIQRDYCNIIFNMLSTSKQDDVSNKMDYEQNFKEDFLDDNVCSDKQFLSVAQDIFRINVIIIPVNETEPPMASSTSNVQEIKSKTYLQEIQNKYPKSSEMFSKEDIRQLDKKVFVKYVTMFFSFVRKIN